MSSTRFAGSSSETVRGSSAIPQMGHVPGAFRTISGCIGQTHCVAVAATGSFGSSAIPHFGQGPGWSDATSGSIGQIQVPAPWGTGRIREAGAGAPGPPPAARALHRAAVHVGARRGPPSHGRARPRRWASA
jgi:hypothetical protein